MTPLSVLAVNNVITPKSISTTNHKKKNPATKTTKTKGKASTRKTPKAAKKRNGVVSVSKATPKKKTPSSIKTKVGEKKSTQKKKPTREQNRVAVINNEISEWSRPNAFNSSTELDEIAWASFYRNMTKQIPQRFQRKHITATAREGAMGLGTRSSVVSDLLVDDDAKNASTTNVKRLSRYHWEDIYPWIRKRTLSSTRGYNKNG